MIRNFVLIALVFLFPGTSFGATCSSTIPQGTTESCDVIVDNGVTRTFASNQTVGQFITGDYFVVLPTGSVAVTISPAPVYSGDNTRNGSQINPTTFYQPFDGRPDYYFDSSLGFESGDTISAGDSLVSTVSDTDAIDDVDVLGRSVSNHESYIDSASVLTIVATQPSANSFRPASFGVDKTVYDADDIDYSKFASMVVTNTTMAHMADPAKSITENYADYFKRPWIQWCYGHLGRQVHPLTNQPNYYEYSYNTISEGALIANSNLVGKEDVIKGIIQVGIDSSAVMNGGAGDRTISRLPSVIASVALGEPSLLTTSTKPMEIQDMYYGTGWQADQPTALYREKGYIEFEEDHPSTWPSLYVSNGTGCKLETYRRATHSNAWTGMALAVRVMRVSTQFNHNAFLDYMDRWRYEVGAIDQANIDVIQQYCVGDLAHGLEPGGATTSPFVSTLWDTYRDTLPDLGAQASSVTKDNITWALNGDYTVGQFVTGDWYVVAPSGLSITNITTDGIDTLGGSMLNPAPSTTQGYDPVHRYTDFAVYDASLNVGLNLPIVLSPGDKLVSTTLNDYYSTARPDSGISSQSGIWQAAILTVVSSAPASGSFRPGLSDLNNTIYNVSDIDWTLLQNVIPASGAPTPSSMYDRFARPWIDHFRGWPGRDIHPRYNMQDYGGYLAGDLGKAALLVNCDYTQAEKEPLVIGLIQNGLDFYHNLKRYRTFYQQTPAHILGRKFPVMFAGNMLDITEIKAIWPYTGSYLNSTWDAYPSDAQFFSEDQTIAYVRAGDVTETEGGSDSYSDQEYNYTTAMIGMAEWFHQPYNERYKGTPSWTRDPYRHIYHAISGSGLAVKVMGWETQWNNQAFFDYLDRYYAIASGDPDPAGYTVPQEASGFLNYGSTSWFKSMWDEYGDSGTPPTFPDGYPAPVLSNRYPTTTLASGTTSVIMSVTSNENATVKYGTVAGIDYASISNTMSGGGTTSHAVFLTGLTDGSSTTYYLRTSDAEGNVTTTDTIITVAVAATADACDSSHFWPCTAAGLAACEAAGFNWWPAEDDIPATCRTIADTSTGVGNNLVANGDFADVTGVYPDDWNTPSDTSNGDVTASGGVLLAHNDGGTWPPVGVSQEIGTPGDEYEIIFDTWGDQAELYTLTEDSEYFETPGTYIRTITADEAGNLFHLQAHHNTVKDTYFDNVVIRRKVAAVKHGFKQVGSSF